MLTYVLLSSTMLRERKVINSENTTLIVLNECLTFPVRESSRLNASPHTLGILISRHSVLNNTLSSWYPPPIQLVVGFFIDNYFGLTTSLGP